MKNTGFSEITIDRLNYKGKDPWYIELALTGNCNFNCKYCNRFKDVLDYNKVEEYFKTFNQCKHVQITGGEPTLHKDFMKFIQLCKYKSVKVGLSTNGSWGIDNYKGIDIDMFSISLDDYDEDILIERGYRNPRNIIETIKELSKIKYVNIGLVVDSINISRIEKIIDFILNLGVDDIKLSTNTKDELIPEFKTDYSQYPILDYRVKNFKENNQMRGFPSEKCYISLNDITLVGDSHYPCLVYFREKGLPIGKISSNIMQERLEWFKNHNSKMDPICSKFCMDFKCEFNREMEK